MQDRATLLARTGDEALVDGYYLPVVRFFLDARHRARSATLVAGVSGPQGCGKSTLVAHAVAALEATGLRAAAVSIDDFYLTHAEQRALAARHPGNRYLEHRGYPGTHDVTLGAETLGALASRDDSEARVPVYDKGAHGGRGDRSGESRSVRTPLDVVLVEGWMLGFRALSPDALDDAHLRDANALLPPYDAWIRSLDAFVHLDARDLASIVRWRVDAERARREATGVGLSDDDARDYIERFLPAYRAYGPALRASPPVAGPTLRIELGDGRRP